MRNTIRNADAFEFLKTIPSSSVDLIITDPPYDFDAIQKTEIHYQFQRVCRGAIIVFSPPENQWILPAHQYLFWVKPISTKNTSKNYSRFVEMIFVYQRGVWNADRHWSQYPNVFMDLVDTSKIHPFRKPPSLIKRLLLNHSNKGDLVLDPFMGSGTTIFSCLENDRDYIGVEKDKDCYEFVADEFHKFLKYKRKSLVYSEKRVLNAEKQENLV